MTTKNGKVKPDHRDKYLFGSSLPIQEKDVGEAITQLLADLSKRARGGSICTSSSPHVVTSRILMCTDIVLHSPRNAQTKTETTVDRPEKYIDLLKIGLFPTEWCETLRPTLTPYPIYGTFDGVGQTSIIVCVSISLDSSPSPELTPLEHQPSIRSHHLAGEDCD